MIIQITFIRRICGPTEVKNQLGGFHHSFNTLQDGQWMVVIQKEKNRLDDGNAPWREITITLNRIKRHSVDTADWFFFFQTIFLNALSKCVPNLYNLKRFFLPTLQLISCRTNVRNNTESCLNIVIRIKTWHIWFYLFVILD